MPLSEMVNNSLRCAQQNKLSSPLIYSFIPGKFSPFLKMVKKHFVFLHKIQSQETLKTRAGQSGFAVHLKPPTLDTQCRCPALSRGQPELHPLKPHLLRTKKGNTGIPRLIALHFIVLCRYWVLVVFFYKMKVCGNPALSKSTGSIFLTAFARLMLLSCFSNSCNIVTLNNLNI